MGEEVLCSFLLKICGDKRNTPIQRYKGDYRNKRIKVNSKEVRKRWSSLLGFQIAIKVNYQLKEML